MTVENASFISGLTPAYPPGSDSISEGDDHLRLIKTVLQGTFPNANEAINGIHTGTSAPTAKTAGTLWYDTTASNKVLKIYNGTGWVTLVASPDTDFKLLGATNVGWVLPTADGIAGQYLKTDAAGNLDWATISSGKASSCAFRVSLSGNTDAVEFDTVTYNIGSDFDTGTYKFTAPETGYFSISTSTRWQGTTGAHSIDDDLWLIKTVSGPTESTIGYTSGWRQYTDSSGTPNYVQGYPTWQVHGVYALNSGDTVHVDVHTEGGGLIVSSGPQTYFQGYQLT